MSEIRECDKDKVWNVPEGDYTLNEIELMALAGDPSAMYYMGYYHSNGIMGEVTELAFNWYKKASEHGHPEAMWRLSSRYGNRIGEDNEDEDDSIKAYAWSYLAHEGGGKNFNEDECEMIDWKAQNEGIVKEAKEELTPEQLSKAEILITELKKLIEKNTKK